MCTLIWRENGEIRIFICKEHSNWKLTISRFCTLKSLIFDFLSSIIENDSIKAEFWIVYKNRKLIMFIYVCKNL